jgi:outer membrane protein assembly factor BamE (lipoprotein component of BamABCDE complex)
MTLRKLLVCLVVLTAGCANLFFDNVERLRDDNKKNIAQLSVGMTRLDVEKVIGNGVAGGTFGDIVFGRLQHLQVRNPMREERVRGPDGVEYEVLFYYTDLRQRDDKITDDELTPVVFRDGKVAGIGYAYLGERVAKYSGIR